MIEALIGMTAIAIFALAMLYIDHRNRVSHHH